MAARARERVRRRRVRPLLVVLLIIMLLEGAIAWIDRQAGSSFPLEYLYIIPVIVGGIYLGYAGGVGVPVASIVLFHVVEKVLPHQGYEEKDFVWLAMLIVLGTVTARTERDRQRARQHSLQLEQLGRARDELMALIAHDLRTPLAGILNVLRSLAQEQGAGLPQAERELLGLAVATGEEMEGMIGDLLHLHAMEGGALELRRGELEAAALEVSAEHMVEPLARQRGVRIEARAAPGLPAVSADEVMIRRVLVNLLGNALRFSARGGCIAVAVERAGAEMVFSVADEGPGVPAGLQEKIFEKFARADEEVGKRISTGLGLAFAKMAVEAHGGRIWVESPWMAAAGDEPARGSRFRFTLPLARRG